MHNGRICLFLLFIITITGYGQDDVITVQSDKILALVKKLKKTK